MSIFNRNDKKEHPTRNANEFDKQILRINALEVQLKKLLEFEKQFRASMYGMPQGESSLNELKNTTARKRFQGVHSKDARGMGEFPKANELSRRIEKLEKIVQGISSSRNDSNAYSLPHNIGSMDEKRLRRLVDQIVLEKLAAQNNKHRSEWQKGNDSHSSQINMRLLALEQNYILVNEVQAGLLKRMDELVEKHNELLKKWEETDSAAIRQNPIMIDKLYIDKYEQNNNFAQIGIRELSGALNIGATYGKDVIPKKITEEAKVEIEKMKAAKEEMQSSKGQPDNPQTDESSSDLTQIPLEGEEPYIDIDIEDDSSFDNDLC
jgi:hypothetical protein